MAVVPPGDFLRLATQCSAEATRTGDSRYAVLSEMFAGIADWWSIFGSVPTPLATAIYDALRSGLPSILEPTVAADAATRAEELRDAVERLQLAPSEWERRGYVHVGP